MSKHIQVIVDGELYIPFNDNIKRCEYCVRDVNVCDRICKCVKNNMKYFVLRPSLKGKLRDEAWEGNGMNKKLTPAQDRAYIELDYDT